MRLDGYHEHSDRLLISHHCGSSGGEWLRKSVKFKVETCACGTAGDLSFPVVI